MTALAQHFRLIAVECLDSLWNDEKIATFRDNVFYLLSERQTAKTVINAMNGDANKLLSSRDFNQRPMTTGLTNAKRMQDYFRRRTAQQKRSATVAPPNGKTYYNQSWLPYEDLKGQGEEKYLKGVAKRLER